MTSPVFRQIAFTLEAFNYLKRFQRDYESNYGIRVNNNQALAIILAEHKELTNEESTVQNAENTAYFH